MLVTNLDASLVWGAAVVIAGQIALGLKWAHNTSKNVALLAASVTRLTKEVAHLFSKVEAVMDRMSNQSGTEARVLVLEEVVDDHEGRIRVLEKP